MSSSLDMALELFEWMNTCCCLTLSSGKSFLSCSSKYSNADTSSLNSSSGVLYFKNYCVETTGTDSSMLYSSHQLLSSTDDSIFSFLGFFLLFPNPFGFNWLFIFLSQRTLVTFKRQSNFNFLYARMKVDLDSVTEFITMIKMLTAIHEQPIQNLMLKLGSQSVKQII